MWRAIDQVAPLARRAVAAVALAFLSACGSEPGLRPLPPDAVVLAFGNSLTHGTGAHPEESYPSVLSRLIGRKVINAGVPGEVSAAGLRRLPAVLDSVSPHLVVLCHGGNDILRKLDLRAAEANLVEMVTLIRARGAEVVLLGVPAPGLFLSTAEHYERIAEELSLPFEGEIVAELLGDTRFKSDAIHPNAAGYARLAQAVEAMLRSAGAI